MMDGIDDIELRHGARRARAYTRAEPVIRCIEEAIREHRRLSEDADGLPPVGLLVALCKEQRLTAARGGPVSYSTVVRALILMGLRHLGNRAATIPDFALSERRRSVVPVTERSL
jgi:hypothetical protein